MKRTRKIFAALFYLGVLTAAAQDTDKFFADAGAFFSENVANGRVDYKSIHSSPEKLNELLSQAKNIRVSKSDVKVYQAFWINTYNLLVIKGIIDNYPTKSPLDISGFFDKTKYDVDGTSITINDIENKKLRAAIGDARYHFVLVCGAKGCPPLISIAYKPDSLEKQLQQQAVRALNDSSFIRVSKGKVAVSEIFKWYKEDFITDGKNEIDFLNRFRKDQVSGDSKLSYYSYDWSLNSK